MARRTPADLVADQDRVVAWSTLYNAVIFSMVAHDDGYRIYKGSDNLLWIEQEKPKADEMFDFIVDAEDRRLRWIATEKINRQFKFDGDVKVNVKKSVSSALGARLRDCDQTKIGCVSSKWSGFANLDDATLNGWEAGFVLGTNSIIGKLTMKSDVDGDDICTAVASQTGFPLVPDSFARYINGLANPQREFWRVRASKNLIPDLFGPDVAARAEKVGQFKQLANFEKRGYPETLAGLARRLGWPMMVAIDSDAEPVDSWCIAPDGSELDHLGFSDAGSGSARAVAAGMKVVEVAQASIDGANVNPVVDFFMLHHADAIAARCEPAPATPLAR